jgi:transcriptional regulator with XRE-family HTH domain
MNKKQTPAKKHSSALISGLLNETTTAEKLQVSTKMQVAARLHDLITAAGLSKGAFAEKANKNPSEITKWLSGTHNFTIDILCEIALALNVPVAELFAFEQTQVINKVQIVVSSKVTRPAVPFGSPLITCCDTQFYFATSKQPLLFPLTSFTS